MAILFAVFECEGPAPDGTEGPWEHFEAIPEDGVIRSFDYTVIVRNAWCETGDGSTFPLKLDTNHLWAGNDIHLSLSLEAGDVTIPSTVGIRLIKKILAQQCPVHTDCQKDIGLAKACWKSCGGTYPLEALEKLGFRLKRSLMFDPETPVDVLGLMIRGSRN